jgi:iron(III) transport system ATP-binding protein
VTSGFGLEILDLEAGYGATTVLRGLDLRVEAASLACVLGPSGCGKTTLLRVVAGFEPARAGSVVIAGQTVDDSAKRTAPEERRVGYVPQEGALFPHLDVAANIGFALPRRTGDDRRRRRQRVGELLDLVGLVGMGRRRPHELSGGQQQRVAVARALAREPDLVLLDEPFAALDANLRQRLRLDVREALAAAGVTAVLVTHDQAEALSLGDQVVLMRAGQVLQAGTPMQLYTSPADEWAAQFIGDATVMPASVVDGVAHTAIGPLPIRPTLTTLEGPVAVVLRPDQVRLAPAGDRAALAATVARAEYYGHDAVIEVGVWPVDNDATVDPVTVVVRVAGHDVLPVGTRVSIEVDGEVLVVPGDSTSTADDERATGG